MIQCGHHILFCWLVEANVYKIGNIVQLFIYFYISMDNMFVFMHVFYVVCG